MRQIIEIQREIQKIQQDIDNMKYTKKIMDIGIMFVLAGSVGLWAITMWMYLFSVKQ